MTTDIVQAGLNLFVAGCLGAAIGFERQWRQRLAGLRTNTLVALGAAIFVTYSHIALDDAGTTRTAAQVVSGIGFLGAGVIFKEGLNVRGLNTAATLWCSAAVGLLAGEGFALYGLLAAVLVIGANTLLRPIVKAINRQPLDLNEEEQHYLVSIDCRAARASDIRSRLVDLVAAVPDLHFSELESAFIEDIGQVEVMATVTSQKRLRARTRDDRRSFQPNRWRHARRLAFEPPSLMAAKIGLPDSLRRACSDANRMQGRRPGRSRPKTRSEIASRPRTRLPSWSRMRGSAAMSENSLLKLFGLGGRVALVTGSSQGIGLALARALGRAGARVVLNGRDAAKLEHARASLQDEQIDAFSASFDVTARETTRAAVAEIEREIGPIDILVNNAGIQRRGPFESFPEETWREIMGVNLDGVFHVTQAVGALMLERSRGRIINICSVASELARATIVPYAATKGALRQMTRGLCAEWAKRNIQINAIAPGYIGTELNRALLDDAAFSQWVCARTPAGRWGDVDELAGAVIFLSSDAASYVNGHVLYVDGGLSTSV